ncbi:J domain-containing protein [candidate division KSB1 bacterium]|nr:J domain-containing protein [candidate division KSB1 bacterium]
MASADFYKILGVNENASASDIKKAYRELAKKYHPDVHKGDSQAENRFKEISEAYAVLSDAKKRAQYDQMRRFGGNTSSHFQNVNFEDLRDLFGGGFKRQRGAGGGFGSIFSDIFGSAADFSQPQKGRDIDAELTISFDVAISGGKQMITVNGRRLSVSIPEGFDDGKKIRLRGQGQPGLAGGAAGDLIITIHVAPHPIFSRKGADIYSTVPVNIVQASLGARVPVQTYDRGTVNLKIPAGIQHGKMLKLSGMGINLNGRRGDHYVQVELTVPKNLNAKAKKALEMFAQTAGIEYKPEES